MSQGVSHKHLLKYWEEHKVEERIRKVRNHLKNPHLNMTETRLKKKLETLDRDMTRSMLQAERKCERRYPNTEWSPTLMNAKRRRAYWSLWLSEMRNNINLSEQRARLAAELGLQEPTTPPNKSAIQKELRMAQKRLQKVIRDAKELRSTFLEQRAEKLAQEGEGTKEQVIKKIKREEESAKSFQLLRQAMGKESQGGINSY